MSRWANCPGFGAMTVSMTPLAHGLGRPASPCGSLPSVTAIESGAWRHLLSISGSAGHDRPASVHLASSAPKVPKCVGTFRTLRMRI